MTENLNTKLSDLSLVRIKIAENLQFKIILVFMLITN